MAHGIDMQHVERRRRTHSQALSLPHGKVEDALVAAQRRAAWSHQLACSFGHSLTLDISGVGITSRDRLAAWNGKTFVFVSSTENGDTERVSFKGTDQGIRVKANRDRGNDISDLSFKDITMDDVRTSILISEYYPKVMPEGPVPAEPVQRLTPHFHNIRIENVKSINSDWAGVIVGLPESPVVDIVLKNVDIQAAKGFQVGYATVDMHHVSITSQDGKPLTMGPEGKVTGEYNK